MQTLNVQLNQTEAAKTQVQTQKTTKLSSSGDGNFQSILESVKTEEKQEKKPSTRAESADKKKAPDSNESKAIAKSEAEETKPSINKTESAPVEKQPEENQETASNENNTDKINAGMAKTLLKDALNVSDEKNLEAEPELSFELDAESMSNDEQALALALQNAVLTTPSEVENIPVESIETEASVLAVAESGDVELELVPEELAATEIETDTIEEASINADTGAEILAAKPDVQGNEKTVDSQIEENLGESANLIAEKPVEEKKSDVKNQLASSTERTEKKDEGTFKITDLRGSESEEKKIASSEKTVIQNEDVKVQDDVASSLLKTAEANILASDNQSAGATGSTFQQMLSQQIQYNAPEFVKAGNIVLKDGNSGSINMILKPENLGNVKISLELSDKIINGQIVVHSKEAFEAFKENLDTLRQAFRNSGFDNANFNLSLADNGAGNFNQGRDDTGAQFMANKTYNNYAGSDEGTQPQSESTAYTKSDEYHIDVVA